ncbi:hypothetical protein [Pseudomonas brenneri]|uniref:hypothetical protein n=1 Tax=Pseudomonas brenneri TaxID=129817 RepID=UPI0028D1D755|nr:hypothetical protein [Pseudomonas brenneri]
MAVQPGPTEKRYAANGVSLMYPVPFLVIEAGDLQVLLNGSLITSGFTHVGVGLPISYIEFTLPPVGDLLLQLNVPFQRLVDYQENGDFLSSTVNRDFDRIWQALKQLLRTTSRSPILGINDIDGDGFYRAKGNGIRDLADPILDQDATTKLWVQQYIGDLVGAGQGSINSAANVLYTKPDGTPSNLQQMSGPGGGDFVGWGRSVLASAVSTAGKMLSAQSVNIWEFAHLVTNKPSLFDPDTWDWAPAINAACAGQSDIFPTVGDTHVVFPVGRYAITNAEVGRRVHMYCAGAVFAPFESDSVQSHLLKFLGHNITYNVVVDMDFSLSYDTALWVRGRYCDFTNTIIWKAKCAWTIGDPAWELDPASGKLGDSEINICGGATPWCLTSIRLYGQNTIAVASAGARIYSSRNNIPVDHPNYAAWMATVPSTVITCGALFYLAGANLANFVQGAPVIESRLQPVSGDPAYSNSYGKALLNGSHIEGSLLFTCAALPAGFTADDDKSMALQVSGCHGYIANTATYWVNMGVAKQGVRITSCGFYGPARTLLAYGTSSPMHIEPASFTGLSGDFFQAMRGNYPVGYERFCAVNATSSSQAFSASPSTLVMPTRDTCDMNSIFESSWYSTSTGALTPRSAMRNVDVNVSVVMASGTASDITSFALLVGGSQVDSVSVYGANPRANLRAARIGANVPMTVTVTSSSSRSATGTASTRMTVVGAV